MRERTVGLLILLLCLSVIVTGCVPATRSPSNSPAGTESPATMTPSTDNPAPQSLQDIPVASLTKKELVTVTIWGVTPDLMYLVPLTVEVDHPEDRPYQAMPLLVNWPDKSGLTVSPWPEGTNIELVAGIDNGTATVNITNLKAGAFGSSREAMALDSIVYTLTGFAEPKIRRVQILVDGQNQETLAGHVDISQPLEPSPYINQVSWSESELNPNNALALTLYFADPRGMYLVPVTRLVPKTQAVARAVVQELILGPEKESGLSPVIPAGTRCLGVKLDQGILTVDFSRELIDNHSGGSTGEALTTGAIVHSLSALPGVHAVQILIEGKPGPSIGGQVVLTEPLRARYLNLLLKP
jgi:germination protein M